ncbi:MAG TPA: alpha/beta hydrolase [Gemmataceae bacterium]|nr:alpha/beta hydrolase [Gemmataceae bacterium]
MFDTLKKLKYGVRVLLARGGGQEETITIAGRSTVLRHGGEGPPFVYLHSTLGESALWLPFLQTWSQQFHVLAPMHPGFGASGGFDEIDTIEDMAFHYVELFDALGLQEINLGGSSLGGWIAAEFAVRWPERVRRLWLSGAPGLWLDEQPLPDLFRIVRDPGELRRLLFHDPESYIARLVIPDDPPDDRVLAAYQAMAVLARLVWDRPYDPKLPRRLSRVGCPVLLIWGAEDRLVPPAYAEAYRRHLPQAEVKLIPNCGHLPMFEREAEFVAAVAKFCA